MKQLLGQNIFTSISVSEKQGLAGQFFFSQNVNIFQDPSKVTLNPKTIKDSGTTVLDLIKWIVPVTPYATDIYLYDASGNIYKRTSGGTWSVDRASATIGNGTKGQGMEMMNDYLYYATATTIGRKGLLDGTPSYNDDFLSDAANNLDQSATTSGQTYTLQVAISETATNKLTFTPAKEPIKEIDVLLAAKGTGNWTLTLHDGANNSLGSATVANGSLVAGGNYQPFTFSSPIRVTNGNSYHFHVTSTVADGTVTTTTLNDFSTVSYREYIGILVNVTDFHPMIIFGSKLLIGNERYVAYWDEAVYAPNQLTFPAGFKVRGFTLIDEFVVVSAWRGSSITSSEEAYLFFWDGSTTIVTYNFLVPSKEGPINALIAFKNRLFSVVGSSGAIYRDYSPFSKKHQIPKLAFANYLEVYPGAITIWKNILHFGVSGATDSTDIIQGVYQWGAKSDSYEEGLNMGFTISTGTNSGTGMAIGAVKGIGNQLFIGWKDGTNYGVDLVTQTNAPFATGSIESLIFDNGTPMMDKLGEVLKISHLSLNTGESMQIGYKSDRASSYTLDTANSTVGDNTTKTNVTHGNAQFKEFQFEVVFGAGSTSPTLTGWSLKYDDMLESISFGRKK